MTTNFAENFKPIKRPESVSLKEELLSLAWSNLEKNPKNNPDQKTLDLLIKNEILTKEESEEVLNDEGKLKELIDNLLNDELILRQEKIDSSEPDQEKVKNDILLEVDKKVGLCVENYPLFEKCRKIFSNAKNLEDFFKIRGPLTEIAKKIGHYDASDTPEARKRNEAMTKQGKILLERPFGIFQLFIDSGQDLHNINGLYLPDKGNPDGGDGWEDKKIGNKQISTVFDTQGHGLSQAYTKLFIGKALSLTTDNSDDLFEVDNFLLEIDEASLYQFQLNAAMIRTEIEEDENGELNMNVLVSGDTIFWICPKNKSEIIISGFEGEYAGIKNINFKRMSAIGAGYKNKTSFKKSENIKLNKGDEVFLSSDGGKGGIKDVFEQIGKTKTINSINGETILDSIKNRKTQGKQRDDITVLKVR